MSELFSSRSKIILQLFNFAGAALVFFGIAYFISSNWDALIDPIKILSTLGAALVFLCSALLLRFSNQFATLSSVFFLLSALLLPIGLSVTFQILHIPWIVEHLDFAVSLITLMIYLCVFYYYPNHMLLFIVILFASWFFNNTVYFIAHTGNTFYRHLSNYIFIVIGMSYISLGRYLSINTQYSMTGLLYFFGSLFVLLGSFLGTVFYPTLNVWSFVSAFSILMAFVFSVILKSRAMLTFAAIFLVLYLADMSYKYAKIFGNFGWSFILVLLGLALIALGYLIFYLKQKLR